MNITVDWTKLIAVLVFVIALVILLVTDSVEWDNVSPIFLLLTGYVVGNGRAAAKGVMSQPIIKPGDNDGMGT